MDKELKMKALEACLAVGKLGVVAARRAGSDPVADAINRIAMQFANEIAEATNGELPRLTA